MIKSRVGEIKRCSVCGEQGHSKAFHIPLPENKTCRTCGETMPIDVFRKQRRVRSNGTTYENISLVCRDCDIARCKTRYRSSYAKRLSALLAAIRNRERTRDIYCSLTLNELLAKIEAQKGLCFYSKEPLSLDTGNMAVSIDRINPFGPYTDENTVLVTWLVNMMKRQQTQDEFVSLCRKIASSDF